MTVNVVTFTWPAHRRAARAARAEWEAATGGKINITTYPFSDLFQKAPDGPLPRDQRFQPDDTVPPLARQTSRARATSTDLTDQIANDPGLAWDDVVPFLRDFVARSAARSMGVADRQRLH